MAALGKRVGRNRVRGSSTLTKWIKKYEREDILPKRIKVETMQEIDELQAIRKRIRELEAALADVPMDYCLESAFLDRACERLGTTTEELKKKKVMTAYRKAQDKGEGMRYGMKVGQLATSLA